MSESRRQTASGLLGATDRNVEIQSDIMRARILRALPCPIPGFFFWDASILKLVGVVGRRKFDIVYFLVRNHWHLRKKSQCIFYVYVPGVPAMCRSVSDVLTCIFMSIAGDPTYVTTSFYITSFGELNELSMVSINQWRPRLMRCRFVTSVYNHCVSD